MQIEERERGLGEWTPDELLGRVMTFAARCLKVRSSLPRSKAGQWIAGQLARSSTSVGANYEEACAGERRADFVHKMQVSLKEVRESRYWLAMIELSGMMSPKRLEALRAEAHELVLIFSKSVVTAKRNKDPD